ncbi:CDP-glycerol glycerophosphotransferase family protein [Bacillus amyloliquefaciens]|uniref:CDP-glycerol glycerophosphotransferase family protein n=1 Tax=Bacillus amyloliquefaciens TaxID=1390 RepID=UPI00214F9C60|nr:CDP-glycerol glycerophosphotransferase family protein [Bacillus amyloliquefaciens]MCR4371984.1 CDP-glycerol glycerophosphotransferase family protein [Bacillus amyloliquefaciens]
MDENTVSKCILKSLKNNVGDLALSISLESEEPLAEEVKCYLKLKERRSGAEDFIILEKESPAQYSASINIHSFPEPLEMGQTYDFYVILGEPEAEEEEAQPQQVRLSVEAEAIERAYHLDHTTELLILPYTTDKGNFSLKVKREAKIVKFDEIQLKAEEIMISGYAGYLSSENQLSVKNLQFVIKKGGEDPVEKHFPIEMTKKTENIEQLREDAFTPEIFDFQIKIPLKDIPYSLEKRFVYRMFMEFHCENDEAEPIVLSSTPLVLGDRKNKLKGLISVVNKDSGPVRYEVYKKKKKQTVCIRVNDYSLKTRMRYFIKGKKKRFISKMKKLKKRRNSLITKGYKVVFRMASKMPVKSKTIIFESFNGKQYSCNPRAIYEYMQINHPEYKMYWSVNKQYAAPFKEKGIQYINRLSIKWLFAMARAEYWVVNSRLPLWIPKPEHTTYLQTWHGTPLKRLAMDMEEVHMPGTNTKKYKKNFIKEASNWDYLISPNAYSSEIFARAFQFDKTMIESGYPRNDFLHNDNNNETITAIKRRLNLPEDKKIILYAPTWRDDQFYAKGRYKFDLDLDLHKLREELGDEYLVILRMHYLVAENFDLGPFEGFAYDFSAHEDIRELYMISDLLITDYSSVFFDFANLKRPMLFFVPDIETYRDKLRGFYFDFEKDAPGPLVKTTEETIEAIKHISSPDYQHPVSFKPFYDKFCYLESGHSSEKVVKIVFESE